VHGQVGLKESTGKAQVAAKSAKQKGELQGSCLDSYLWGHQGQTKEK
jgi:hypothetical protein